jgi:hypothetical protein
MAFTATQREQLRAVGFVPGEVDRLEQAFVTGGYDAFFAITDTLGPIAEARVRAVSTAMAEGGLAAATAVAESYDPVTGEKIVEPASPPEDTTTSEVTAEPELTSTSGPKAAVPQKKPFEEVYGEDVLSQFTSTQRDALRNAYRGAGDDIAASLDAVRAMVADTGFIALGPQRVVAEEEVVEDDREQVIGASRYLDYSGDDSPISVEQGVADKRLDRLDNGNTWVYRTSDRRVVAEYPKRMTKRQTLEASGISEELIAQIEARDEASRNPAPQQIAVPKGGFGPPEGEVAASAFTPTVTGDEAASQTAPIGDSVASKDKIGDSIASKDKLTQILQTQQGGGGVVTRQSPESPVDPEHQLTLPEPIAPTPTSVVEAEQTSNPFHGLTLPEAPNLDFIPSDSTPTTGVTSEISDVIQTKAPRVAQDLGINLPPQPQQRPRPAYGIGPALPYRDGDPVIPPMVGPNLPPQSRQRLRPVVDDLSSQLDLANPVRSGPPPWLRPVPGDGPVRDGDQLVFGRPSPGTSGYGPGGVTLVDDLQRLGAGTGPGGAMLTNPQPKETAEAIRQRQLRGGTLTTADLEGLTLPGQQELQHGQTAVAAQLPGAEGTNALRGDVPSQLIQPFAESGRQVFGQTDPTSTFGRPQRSGLESLISDATGQLAFDNAAQTTAEEARINAEFDKRRVELARMLQVSDNNGQDIGTSGANQRQFEQLATGRANALLDAEIRRGQRQRDEQRQNIQTFQGAQESREAAALQAQQAALASRQQNIGFLSQQDQTALAQQQQALQEEATRRGLQLQGAELFGGSAGMNFADAGIDVTDTSQGPDVQLGQFANAFQQSMGRIPTQDEINRAFAGERVGGQQTAQSSQFGQQFAQQQIGENRQFTLQETEANRRFQQDELLRQQGELEQNRQFGAQQLAADRQNAAQQADQFGFGGGVTAQELGVRTNEDGTLNNTDIGVFAEGFERRFGRPPTNQETLAAFNGQRVGSLQTLEAAQFDRGQTQLETEQDRQYAQQELEQNRQFKQQKLEQDRQFGFQGSEADRQNELQRRAQQASEDQLFGSTVGMSIADVGVTLAHGTDGLNIFANAFSDRFGRFPSQQEVNEAYAGNVVGGRQTLGSQQLTSEASLEQQRINQQQLEADRANELQRLQQANATTALFGETEGMTMADFGLSLDDGIDGLNMFAAQFKDRFGREPTQVEVNDAYAGRKVGGRTTLESQQLKEQQNQFAIQAEQQQQQIDNAQQNAVRELGQREATLYGSQQGVSANSLGVPNPQASPGLVVESFQDQFGRKPSAEELTGLMNGESVGGRSTLQSRQQTFIQDIARAQELGFMRDPVTGVKHQTLAGVATTLNNREFTESVRQFNKAFLEGQDIQDEEFQERYRQFNAQMAQASERQSADIAQQWANITGTTEVGDMKADDLGVDTSVFGSVPPHLWDQTSEYQRMQENFFTNTGENVTPEQMDALIRGEAIQAGTMTAQSRQFSATIMQQQLERGLAYKQLSDATGLSNRQLQGLEDENDRRWQQVTLDVASQVGLDEDNWQSALMQYEHLRVDDPNKSEAELRADAMKHFGDNVDPQAFNRGMDIYQRDYGNAKVQQAAAMGMQKEQFDRTVDAMTRQESRENSTWNGILGSTPLDLTLDSLIGRANDRQKGNFSNALNTTITQVLPSLDNARILDVAALEANPTEEGVRGLEVQLSGGVGTAHAYNYTSTIGDLMDNHPDGNWADVIERGLGMDVMASDRFDSMNDTEKENWLRQNVDNVHNMTLDAGQITQLVSGQNITIQPAPRNFLDRFEDAEQLNAIMGWVAGVSPFTQEMGVWEAVGQFAGAATVAGASAFLGRPPAPTTTP